MRHRLFTRIRAKNGKFIEIHRWAFRVQGQQWWILCDEEEKERALRMGLEVTTGPNAYRENMNTADEAARKAIRGMCSRFPGRTPARLRPDRKPEKGYKVPKKETSNG